MRWPAWLRPWRRRNGDRDAAADRALREQQRKLRETDRLGAEVRELTQSLQQRLDDGDFLAEVEAALARRRR